MDLAYLRQLVRLMQRAELTELEVEDKEKGLRVHLRRGPDAAGLPAHVPSVVQVVPTPSAPAAPGRGAGPEEAAPSPPAAAPVAQQELVRFTSPMVGTFYRSASPDAEPYAEPGSKIDEDSVVCIIEAMKVMNEIKAEMRGEVVEVLVENGEPVEFGQPLFLVRRT